MILDPSHVLLVVRQPPGDLGAFGTFVPSKIDRLGSSNPKYLGKSLGFAIFVVWKTFAVEMWVYAVASDCRLVFYSRLHRTISQVGYLTTIKRAWTIQLLVCFGKVGMIKGPQQEFLFTDREGRLLE